MKRILNKRPSPALAVAFIALLAATGGGTASALSGSNTVFSDDIVNNTIRAQDVRENGLNGTDIENGSVKGAEIRNSTIRAIDVGENSLNGTDIENGSIRGADLRPGVAPDFAAVRSDGALGRNDGVVSASKTGVGEYRVTFARDVSGCAFSAQVASTNAGEPPSGEVGVGRLAAVPAGVRVKTRDSAGGPADRTFHLIVAC